MYLRPDLCAPEYLTTSAAIAESPRRDRSLGARRDRCARRAPSRCAGAPLSPCPLDHLGRHGDALAEIDAFAPIQAEVLGHAPPQCAGDPIPARQVVDHLGRYTDALAEIEALAPVEIDVLVF
jgi:hypothetical protein